ncbi:MAG: sodium:alanine symporter family protein [Oscillospiraceae bacterium]|nr:sodium:alanine symporter family protein [Oscillospiraceae bacterium]
MEAFNNFINWLNGVIWSDALVYSLLGVHIFFTVTTRGAQFRLIKQMWKHMFERTKALPKSK